MTEPSSANAESVGPDNLRGELFRLAMPVLAEQLLIFCVGFYDVYLAGQLGNNQTATIGLTAYVSWLASLIFGLVGTGTVAVVAREWGGGHFDVARQVAARSLTITLVYATGIFAFLQAGAYGFPILLGMEGEQRQIATMYLRADAFSEFFAGWILIGNAALRGSGDMRSPLAVLCVTNAVNIIVATACVYGWGPLPRMEVWGIVAGTMTAQVCGALMMTAILFSGASRMHIRLRDMGFHRETIGRILRVGGPAALGGMLTITGHFLFLMVISRLSSTGFDSASVAAHMVGVRVEAISYLPIEAIGIAAATLAGHSLGAGLHERAKRVGREALRPCLHYAAFMMVIFYCFAPEIYARMQSDPNVSAVGIPAFRLMAAYQIPNAVLIVYMNTLRGVGDTRFPILCSLFGNLLVRVLIGYFCGVILHGGLVGAWVGMGADNLLRSIMITWRYRSGRWVKFRV